MLTELPGERNLTLKATPRRNYLVNDFLRDVFISLGPPGLREGLWNATLWEPYYNGDLLLCGLPFDFCGIQISVSEFFLGLQSKIERDFN